MREACSLTDAIAAVEGREAIDLVLLDVTLPGSHGLATLRGWR